MASDDRSPTLPVTAADSQIPDSLRTFGAVFKALRDEAQLTQEEIAPLVGFSSPYVAKIEQGRRFPPRDLSQRVEPHLGAVAAKVLTAAAKTLRRKPGLASWSQPWAAIEEEAVSLYTYECRVIPGLLQPESYIRTLARLHLPPLTESETEQRIAARLDRQRLLDERPNTDFCFVIEQFLLERRVGGTSVTRDVVDRLLEVGKRRNVEIQVLELRQEDHACPGDSMHLAETRNHEWFGYTEGHRYSNLVNAACGSSAMLQRYGKLRGQALDARATAQFLERMREKL